jgi:hypothetical protein
MNIPGLSPKYNLFEAMLQEPRSQPYLKQLSELESSEIDQNSTEFLRKDEINRKCGNWNGKGPHLGMRPSGWIPCSRQ